MRHIQVLIILLRKTFEGENNNNEPLMMTNITMMNMTIPRILQKYVLNDC